MTMLEESGAFGKPNSSYKCRGWGYLTSSLELMTTKGEGSKHVDGFRKRFHDFGLGAQSGFRLRVRGSWV